HLTEVEHHGDQRCRVRVDLLREVGHRGALADADLRGAVAAGDDDATDRRRLHLLELCPLRALGLALLALAATTAEGTLGAATTAGTTAVATATTAGTATGATTGTATTTGRGTPATTGPLARTRDGRAGRHHP